MIGYSESVNMNALRGDFSRKEAERRIAETGETDLWELYEKHIGRELTGKELHQFVCELEIFVVMEVTSVGIPDRQVGGSSPDLRTGTLREVNHSISVS